MKVYDKKISDLKEYENNPRKNDGAVAAVAKSIREFGFRVPIVLDKDGVIIAGHTRLKAARELGLETVPCVIADDLTLEQAAAFRLADNKTAELSDWDFEKLEAELAKVSDEFHMNDFGFNKVDFSNLDSMAQNNDEYDEFLEKFKPKKTTDDCYTPKDVYDAVLSWAKKVL